MTRAELEQAYVEELAKHSVTPAYGWGVGLEGEALTAKCREIAAKMLGSIIESCKRGARSDWLSNNPALKSAAKRLGLKTSPAFRAAVRAMEG